MENSNGRQAGQLLTQQVSLIKCRDDMGSPAVSDSDFKVVSKSLLSPFQTRVFAQIVSLVARIFLFFGCVAQGNPPPAKDATQFTADNSNPDAISGEGVVASEGSAQDTTQSENAGDETAPESEADGGPEADTSAVANNEIVFSETKIIRFEWSPTGAFHGSYSLSNEADQHRVVIPKGIEKGKTYPVVIGFHGQPKRGKDPRDYMFMAPVQQQVLKLVENEEIQPVILVMPVFRFLGTNWPKLNPKLLQQKVTELLLAEGVTPGEWYAFGHSGAAGCGGNGLNQIHVMSPRGVGFFDTCLGKEWQQQVRLLQKNGVETFNIHSVETAGFKPRQRPEYQADFDFGRAYSPLGIEPVPCPKVHPGEKLRSLPYRCSATKDGVIKSFVIDTGEGAEAHKAILEPAISFFLKHFLGKNNILSRPRNSGGNPG